MQIAIREPAKSARHWAGSGMPPATTSRSRPGTPPGRRHWRRNSGSAPMGPRSLTPWRAPTWCSWLSRALP